MKLLIVGFNARPIAKSAQEAGHEVGVIDYFGDLDLLQLTRNCFSVLKQTPNEILHRKLQRKPADYLYILAEIMNDEQGDFDGIVLGSSFDRFPDIVESFGKLGPKLYSNTPANFVLVRDKPKINQLALDAGFAIPKVESIKDYTEAIDIANNWGYPVVTREDGGGGGAGIKLWQSKEEIESYYKEKQEGPIWIQEQIIGIDASASVICSDNNVGIVSINRQIIGNSRLGAPGPFSYCGNVVPLDNTTLTHANKNHKEILNRVNELITNLQLVGSNGIDFVIADNQLFFMEINPRIQGSLECIQKATDINLVKLHLDSFQKNLELNEIVPKYKRWGFKGILFNNQEILKVRKYPKSSAIVDRTHHNVILEKDDPFCSVVFSARNLHDGYKKLFSLADKIIHVNE
jgi:predicted ATP-grasp superfamily ATP-dependent carboligase